MMGAVYTAISAVLLFWHAAWERVLGTASALGTDWTWILGIISLVLTVRVALFPLVTRQVRAQRAMQRLQPRIRELRERHGNDRAALQAALLELQQTEKVNPFAGFLPILVQAPILIGLLHVLRHLRPDITSEASRTLYGWTLTQFDSAVHAKLFGAPIAAGFTSPAESLALLGASATTVRIVAAVLILVMVATTYLTTRQTMNRSGPAPDPQTRLIQQVMLYGIPLSLLVSGVLFPLGVLLYWTVQNLFALGQQAWILRRYPMPTPESPDPGRKPRRTAAGPAQGQRPAGPRPGQRPARPRPTR